jgi:hypothetical protein
VCILGKQKSYRQNRCHRNAEISRKRVPSPRPILSRYPLWQSWQTARITVARSRRIALAMRPTGFPVIFAFSICPVHHLAQNFMGSTAEVRIAPSSLN